MQLSHRAPRPSFALAALLLALLAVVATLQYRWIGEVSRAERDRMRASLHAAASRFTHDFDREISRVFFSFQPRHGTPAPELGEVCSRLYEAWATQAQDPRVLQDLYLARRDETGRLQLARLDREARSFEPREWPEDLGGVRARLEAGPFAPDVYGGPPPGPIVPEVPALIIPLDRFPGPGRGEGPPRAPRDRGVLIARLDGRVIREELLPGLMEAHFGSRGDYDLAVVSGSGPEEVIYRSSPEVTPERLRSPDIVAPLFTVHPFEDLRGPGRDGPGRSRSPRFGGARFGPPGGDGQWQLLVSHRAGSLEAAVARARLRNLGLGLGVLLLLAVSIALTLVSAQRAQRLARQQIDFIASVSHEMRTPLAAVRSAGQNLSDGVVEDPAQVKRYGALIESEGRRLSGMVEQALQLAGLQSEGRAYRLEEVEPAAVVDAALEECRWALDEKGFRVEKEIAAGLPAVMADPRALCTALKNLVENAIKHGGEARWLAVRARAGPGPAGAEVSVTVEDRGPGIEADDLPHVFEPFYRGRGAEARRVHGSGLGLSVVRQIVEAHRGRVSVDTGERGSAFTIHLPAASAPGPAVARAEAAL